MPASLCAPQHVPSGAVLRSALGSVLFRQRCTVCFEWHVGAKLHHSNLTCFADVEAASDILVNAYLQHPQYFYATEVLGPACLQVTEGQDFLGSLTGMHSSRRCLWHIDRNDPLTSVTDIVGSAEFAAQLDALYNAHNLDSVHLFMRCTCDTIRAAVS